MAIIPQLDRLQAQLLTSGLSQKNNALFQVIDQLIKALRQGINEVESQVIAITPPSGGGGGGGTIITSGNMPMGDISDDNENTDWNWGPQGPQGIQGIQGLIGPAGMDGEDCECESMPFVGSSLVTGGTPATGGTFTQLI
jgi:hypothetical protein